MTAGDSETCTVYIITNKTNTTLYTGVTKDLKRRMYQHKNKVRPKTFSARYNLSKLVHFEKFKSKEKAYLKERQLKKWNRDWKVQLIEETNSDWIDLTKMI
ncbi:GIY-YIG nuclease family protein [Gangjinia marincola]|uniref:GIY-YIG nuclease family protein n=1 Tax=Gangjinia marincola TaxID=578463 RepID=A0ABP3XSP3_9FLAO